jgi:hypothetical protein
MNQLTAGLVVLIGILGGFYAGARYGQGHPPPSSSAAAATSSTGTGAGAGDTGTAGTGRGGGAGGGFAPAATGTITAVSGNTITVHDRQSGKDVKVDVSSARVSKTAQGSASDLTQNQTVTVIGQAGSDGTVAAQTISIGGGGFGGGGGGGGGGRQRAPSPSPSS